MDCIFVDPTPDTGDFDTCPNCEGQLIACGGGEVLCATCAKREIERLRAIEVVARKLAKTLAWVTARDGNTWKPEQLRAELGSARAVGLLSERP